MKLLYLKSKPTLVGTDPTSSSEPHPFRDFLSSKRKQSIGDTIVKKAVSEDNERFLKQPYRKFIKKGTILPSENLNESNITHVVSKVSGIIIGLENIGNSCYMNSCLQCLSNIPEIREYFLSLKKSDTKLANAYAVFLREYSRLPLDSSFKPTNLKRELEQRYRGYEQQDAQEFLLYLLDTLHEELNEIKSKPPYYEIIDKPGIEESVLAKEYWKYYTDRNASLLTSLFCGQIKSRVTCAKCTHQSICFDVFWDLSVPVALRKQRQLTLDYCLQTYTLEEYITDGYQCAGCKRSVAVTKEINIYQPPKYLILHLKRFQYTNIIREKITTEIEFPITNWSIQKYCSSTAQFKKEPRYDLISSIHHFGTIHGGHYIAECLNQETGKWYECNDSTVTLIPTPPGRSKSIYMLFYQLRS